MLLRNIEFGTTPIVIHNNGSSRPVSGFFRKLRSMQASAVPLSPSAGKSDLTIFTWNSSHQRGCFEQSLDALGLTYTVLGAGIDRWRNIYKLRLNQEFLQSVRTNFVMAADSKDVLLLSNPLKLVQRLDSLPGCEMLFNAERNHFPPNSDTDKLEERLFQESDNRTRRGQPFCYLNSGAWVARTAFCRTLHEEALTVRPPRRSDDQGVYKILYTRHYPLVQIDHHCTVFQTLFRARPAEFELIM